ncbi:hypothetical protein KC356_g145 [Hortaea werneckii]|nr:hypothetical protein KC356_g145 [Hortaea werneckii]
MILPNHHPEFGGRTIILNISLTGTAKAYVPKLELLLSGTHTNRRLLASVVLLAPELLPAPGVVGGLPMFSPAGFCCNSATYPGTLSLALVPDGTVSAFLVVAHVVEASGCGRLCLMWFKVAPLDGYRSAAIHVRVYACRSHYLLCSQYLELKWKEGKGNLCRSLPATLPDGRRQAYRPGSKLAVVTSLNVSRETYRIIADNAVSAAFCRSSLFPLGRPGVVISVALSSAPLLDARLCILGTREPVVANSRQDLAKSACRCPADTQAGSSAL